MIFCVFSAWGGITRSRGEAEGHSIAGFLNNIRLVHPYPKMNLLRYLSLYILIIWDHYKSIIVRSPVRLCVGTYLKVNCNFLIRIAVFAKESIDLYKSYVVVVFLIKTLWLSPPEPKLSLSIGKNHILHKLQLAQ